jgi:hypothetical protein
MADQKLQIMNMVKDGTISPEEAIELLQALDSGAKKMLNPPQNAQDTVPCCTATVTSNGKKPRFLKIQVQDEEENKNVNIVIPIALAKFAGKFIPKEARAEMSAQGVDLDLDGIMDCLEKECCQNLVEVTEGNKKIVRIFTE